MRQAGQLLMVAVRFLTRLPLPLAEFSAGDLQRAQALFPAVGIVVAAVGVGVRVAVEPWWGAATATVSAVLAMVVITGGLHEDGLADTADGLWGGCEPSQRLAIMRDSRVGTYGIIALAGALGLRVALLAPLGTAGFARAVLAAHVLGRSAMLVLAHRLPSAASGAGAQVVGALPRVASVVALTTVAVVLAATTGRWALAPLAAGALVVAGCIHLFRSRLGGVTGDTLGAGNQVVELTVLAVVSALVQRGLL